jgi:hypothetical protein
MNVRGPPPRISNDCMHRGAAPESTAYGALGIDVSPSTSPATDASARSRSRGGPNHRRVRGRVSIAPPTASGGSAWQGATLCDSEAPVLLGAT